MRMVPNIHIIPLTIGNRYKNENSISKLRYIINNSNKVLPENQARNSDKIRKKPPMNPNNLKSKYFFNRILSSINNYSHINIQIL